MTLPTSWVVFNSDGSSMSISKLVSQGSGKAATIAMSVVVDMDMQWCIHTLHRPLHVPMCSLLSGMPILLNSVDSVFKILNFLDNTKFCAGNPDKVLVFGTSKCFLYMVVQVIVIALVKATCTDSFQECARWLVLFPIPLSANTSM